MKLTDLDPWWAIWQKLDTGKEPAGINDAHGVAFTCPVCKGHTIICWKPEVPQTVTPKPGRWNMHGTGFDDLSLEGTTSNSVKIEGRCNAHFFIIQGRIDLC